MEVDCTRSGWSWASGAHPVAYCFPTLPRSRPHATAGRRLIPAVAAYGSSEWADYCGGGPCGPQYAIDGIVNDDNRIFHTGFPPQDQGLWLSLDLGNAVQVSRIVIWNRPGCCAERTVGAELRVGNTSITQYSDTSKIISNPLVWKQPPNTTYADGSATTVDLNTTAVGRWVTLQNFNPSNDLEAVLQVAELQVYGAGAVLACACMPRPCVLRMPSPRCATGRACQVRPIPSQAYRGTAHSQIPVSTTTHCNERQRMRDSLAIYAHSAMHAYLRERGQPPLTVNH